jgi:SAM-dependent methyltransferase
MGSFEQRYLDGAYLADTGDWHEEDAAWKARHLHATIAGAGLQPRSIADIGCGSGGVLVQLQAMLAPGTDFTGYEIAEPAFALAQPRANAHLRFINGSALEAQAHYDLALAMDVFEHVPDYLGFLEQLRDKADRFIFHVPLDLSVRALLSDVPMQRRRSVGHLHYFTTATAQATLEESGYRVVSAFHTHAIVQPAPTGLKQKLRMKPHEWLFKASPERCATWLGGCSWMVLAEPAR